MISRVLPNNPLLLRRHHPPPCHSSTSSSAPSRSEWVRVQRQRQRSHPLLLPGSWFIRRVYVVFLNIHKYGRVPLTEQSQFSYCRPEKEFHIQHALLLGLFAQVKPFPGHSFRRIIIRMLKLNHLAILSKT